MRTNGLGASLGVFAIGASFVVAGLIASSQSAAQAPLKNCYEQIGCPHQRYFKKTELGQISCQFLRDVRNTVYKQNGYCFKTDAGKRDFGNEGCKYPNEAEVPLNEFERHNIALIRQVEKEQGCR